MFVRKITRMLLVSSVLFALQAGPVFAGTKGEADASDLAKYEARYGLESIEYEQEDGSDSLEERSEKEEAELEENRKATAAAADEAGEAAARAKELADQSESTEVKEAAQKAAEDAEAARAAADLANGADDSRTIGLALEISEAAKESALKAAEETEEAAKAEAEAKEAELMASAEYLGTFKLTAYCNCARCCGTAGNATASGVMPTSGHTVAMGGIEFGTKLLINGTVYTVEDRGTPYGHVDIFMDSHEEALQFGMSSAEVYLIKD